jgi:hypothetical protein
VRNWGGGGRGEGDEENIMGEERRVAERQRRGLTEMGRG